MSFRPGRRAAKRLGMVLAAVSLALFSVSTAMAHTGAPSTATVTKTGPLSITASGTWSWPAMATAGHLSFVGYAVDWGDVTTGNAIGTLHIGDGTAATNVIALTPAQGASGSWGPVSHTYALPGTYNVCVIIYDLGLTQPFLTTGYHSTQAGGTGHNTDNSVDHNLQTPAMCATFDATAVTPTPVQSVGGATSQPTVAPSPFQSFEGATGVPGVTPPPTVSGTPSSSDPGLPVLAILIGSMLASVAAFRVRFHLMQR